MQIGLALSVSHKLTAGAAIAGAGVDDILLETSDHLLTEDGYALVLDVNTTPADFTISVPGGSYAADSLDATNATNGAGGVSGGKMAATSAAAWTVLSVNSSRDQEISTSGSRFYQYLRYDGDKALYMRVDKTGVDGSTGILTVGVCTGLSTSTELASNYYPLYTTSTANATITGFTGGTEYLVGCSGFDIYVKIDGTERLRIQDYHHLFNAGVTDWATGKAGVKPSGGYGVGAVTVNFNDAASIYSSPGIIDVRDLTGWKNNTTTGTIGAASTSLVVASATGLAVGDYLIVEIGNEAGVGARGTQGVGAQWPTLTYADATARTADTGQANATYAAQLDTGDVYRWTSGSPGSWAAVASTSYYSAKCAPKSLVARITAISGTTITLDTAATVDATNANVYVDVQPVINSLFAVYDGASNLIYSLAPTPMTVNIPTGTYYMSAGIYVPQNGTNVVHIQGGGKTTCILRSPKGVHSASIVSKSIGGSINDLHLWGNARFTGYGLPYNQCRDTRGWTLSGSTFVRNNSTAQAMVSNISETAVVFGYGAIFYQTSTCTIDNVKATDPWQSGVGAAYCTSPTITNCDVVHTTGLAQYVQWMIQCADGTDETVTNCTVTSAILTGAAESFRSTGGTWTNITLTNGVFSVNSGDDLDIDGLDITIEASSRLSGGLGSVAASGVPCLGFNVNIGTPVTIGCRITNLTMDQQGVIDASDNLLTLVNVGASNPNISIDGAVLTSVDYVNTPPDNTNYAHIVSNGTGTSVANTQTTGQSVYAVTGSGNRNVHLAGSGGSVDAFTQANVGDYYVA